MNIEEEEIIVSLKQKLCTRLEILYITKLAMLTNTYNNIFILHRGNTFHNSFTLIA